MFNLGSLGPSNGFSLVETVRDGNGGRLVNNAHAVEAGNGSSVPGLMHIHTTRSGCCGDGMHMDVH
jgi:hypothetical protein